MKAHIDAREQPFYKEWTALKSDSRAASTWTAHNPVEDIGGSDGVRQRACADAQAAMYNALIWQLTGQKAHANAAVKTLMGWANVVTSAQNQLFQYPCREFAQAAEMLRKADGSFYEGWAEADVEIFLTMVRDIFVPALRTQKTNGMSSWSAGAINGLMACGVLLDDEEIYNEALGYFTSKSIPGSLVSATRETGQVKEMGRDNVHANLALYDWGNMAQTAWHQGDDLYGALDNRLMKVFDYWCRYNSGHEDTSWEPWDKWYYISTHNNGFRLRPDGAFFECVYHHYREVKGLDEYMFPYLSAYAKLARPEQNYGTLLFAASKDTSPLWMTKPETPEGVKAEAGIGCVYLSWNHPANEDARGFKVYRSTNGTSFSLLKTWDFYTNNKYKDEDIKAGKTYYYKIVFVNQAGNSTASEVVSATPETGSEELPEGWSLTDIETQGGSALYSETMNGSFAINGTGKDVTGKSDSFTFLYTTLEGDGSLCVRLTSTEETFKKVGIAARGGLVGSSKTVSLELGGTGHRYCYNGSRTTSGGDMKWTAGCDFTYAPCWFKIARNGNKFSTYQSRDGETWHLVATTTCAMGSKAYYGMWVCTGSTSGDTYKAVFDHVSVNGEAVVPTGIQEIGQLDNLRFNKEADAVYDLSGRRVGSSSSVLPKGVYIVNARMVVIR